MSTNNQKYVKTVAKVCRKKSVETALKSMSKTSKSMSLHTEYVKSSPIFLMDPERRLVREPPWKGLGMCRRVTNKWRERVRQSQRQI